MRNEITSKTFETSTTYAAMQLRKAGHADSHAKACEIIDALAVGKKFRLQSRTTVFIVEKQYLAAGFIPSVIGHTPDGKLQTSARMVDVVAVQ